MTTTTSADNTTIAAINNNNNSTSPPYYRLFIQSIKSPHSRVVYADSLRYFMDFIKIGPEEYHKLIDGKDSKLIQADIIEYIIYLRETKKIAPATINLYLAAIKHFYDINEVELKWKKINSFKGEYYEVVENKPYTREQIKRLLDKAEQRNRTIILLLCSTGMRVGAVPEITIGDLTPIDKYGIYQISVYKRTSKKSRYITFCSSECRAEIDLYLQYRERCGEKIEKNAPLFRKTFNRSDLLQVRNNPKPIGRQTIRWIVKDLLNITGVRISPKMIEGQTHNKRTDLMELHGFRKFFDTTCTLAGMDKLYVEKLMGHNIGIKGSYFLPTPEELLEGNEKKLGYISVMDALTINDENRLKKQVEELKITKSEFEIMKEKIEEFEEFKAATREHINAQVKISESLKLGGVKISEALAETLYPEDKARLDAAIAKHKKEHNIID